jgi:hypothetical protein
MPPLSLKRLWKEVVNGFDAFRFMLKPGFCSWKDDASLSDGYGQRGHGRTRVFISYERRSFPLATRLAQALEAEGLAAFIYMPAQASDKRVIDKPMHTHREQVVLFESISPRSARELEATLMRSHAFVFLVSEHSLFSGVCAVEAFSAFFSVARPLGKAHAFVIKERVDLDTPDFMENLPTDVYEPGFEITFARRLGRLFQSRVGSATS